MNTTSHRVYETGEGVRGRKQPWTSENQAKEGQDFQNDSINKVQSMDGMVLKCPPVAPDYHDVIKGEWKQAHLLDHPRVFITILVDTSAQASYSDLVSASTIYMEVLAIADTGAWSDLWSLAEFLAYRLLHYDLLHVQLGLSAANCSLIPINWREYFLPGSE